MAALALLAGLALAGDGFVAEKTLKTVVGKTELAATAYKHEKPGYAALRVFSGAAEVYAHPEMSGTAELVGWTKDFGPGTLLYRWSGRLHVLRWDGSRLRKAGDFPEAELRDLDKDGTPEVVSRSLPVGEFFALRCGDFGAVAKRPRRLDVHAWRGERFVAAAADFPALQDEEIAAAEARLAELEPEKLKRPGEFLAAGLALYFAHEAKGQARAGYDRARALFALPSGATRKMKRCHKKMGAELRRRLKIPADWP